MGKGPGATMNGGRRWCCSAAMLAWRRRIEVQTSPSEGPLHLVDRKLEPPPHGLYAKRWVYARRTARGRKRDGDVLPARSVTTRVKERQKQAYVSQKRSNDQIGPSGFTIRPTHPQHNLALHSGLAAVSLPFRKAFCPFLVPVPNPTGAQVDLEM